MTPPLGRSKNYEVYPLMNYIVESVLCTDKLAATQPLQKHTAVTTYMLYVISYIIASI